MRSRREEDKHRLGGLITTTFKDPVTAYMVRVMPGVTILRRQYPLSFRPDVTEIFPDHHLLPRISAGYRGSN